MKQKQKLNDYLFNAEAISFYLNFLGITCREYSDLIASQIELHWLCQIPNPVFRKQQKGSTKENSKVHASKD